VDGTLAEAEGSHAEPYQASGVGIGLRGVTGECHADGEEQLAAF
jgi:hypothetical protein